MLPPPGSPQSSPTPTPKPPAKSPRRSSRPPGGTLTRAQRRAVSPTERLAFSQLEGELGGRARLASTLMGAELPDHLKTFTGMLLDPINDDLPLAEIALIAGVSLPQLQRTFIDARKMRGIVLATDKIVEKAPDVAFHVMEDAIPGLKPCTTCLGARLIEVADAEAAKETPGATKLVPCATCGGKGDVYHKPDHETQKTALKLSGLLNEGRGVTVNNLNAQVVKDGGAAGYEKLVSALDGVLYGRGRDRMVPFGGDGDGDVDGDEGVDVGEVVESDE